MKHSVDTVERVGTGAVAVIFTEEMIAAPASRAQHGAFSGGCGLALGARCRFMFRSGAYSVLIREDAAREVKSHSALVAWHGLAAHGALHYDSHRYASRHSQHDTLRLLKAVK